jgi:hypothetical protein
MTIFCKLVFAFQGRTHYLNLYVQLCKEAEHPKNLFLLCVWHLQAAAQGISTDVPICTHYFKLGLLKNFLLLEQIAEQLIGPQ